ncbi:MAG TPA: GDSL-type esterase/lipase family protein [Gammaproteobacteria bacterium]
MGFPRHLAAALLVLLAACGEPPRYDPLPAGAVVLAFGDSVTYGTGAGRGESYPSVLADLTGWQIVNAGIPGDTAQEAAERISGALREARPAVAIIELGGNDFLQRRPASGVKEDLRAIVTAVRDTGAIPVLISVPELSLFGAVTGRLGDSPIYAALADEENVLLVDEVFADVLSDAALRSDRIHPNAAGYRIMAERIASDLARAGLLAGFSE